MSARKHPALRAARITHSSINSGAATISTFLLLHILLWHIHCIHCIFHNIYYNNRWYKDGKNNYHLGANANETYIHCMQLYPNLGYSHANQVHVFAFCEWLALRQGNLIPFVCHKAIENCITQNKYICFIRIMPFLKSYFTNYDYLACFWKTK